MTSMQDILNAREARWLRRLELCRGGALLTLTMNVPGPDKNPPRWNAAHRRIVETVANDLASRILFFEERTTQAGAEAHFVVNLSSFDLKKYATTLEENSPAGRLLDADVTDTLGRVLGREDLGLSPRRCFCCGRAAKECARVRRHSLNELLARAEALLNAHEAEKREARERR